MNYENNIIYVEKFNNDIETIDQLYIKSHYHIPPVNYKNIDKIIQKMYQYESSNEKPDINFWKQLHQISALQGGFLSMENRRKIYSFILEFLFKDEKYKIIPEKVTKKKLNTDETTIKNDCLRSVLFKTFNSDKNLYKYKNEEKTVVDIYIKELMEFTKEALGNCEYFNYYQGYQEICLYFMIIFGRKQGPKYMTMFSKIFLDYALSKKYQINYEMILDILNDCCNLVNKKVNTIINKITKTKPYYSLPWLITIFTHSNENLFNQLALLDYFITCNISHVYFFSANIIVNEFNKISTKFNINSPIDEFMYMEMFLKHFQNIKINLIDFNSLIQKNERINQKYFEDIILITKRKVNNENDKGTLDLLNNKIYDNKIFKKHSFKNNILFIFLCLIMLFLAYKFYK